MKERTDHTIESPPAAELVRRIERALIDVRGLFADANSTPGVPTIVRVALADARDSLYEALERTDG